jgi:hypothetical protein
LGAFDNARNRNETMVRRATVVGSMCPHDNTPKDRLPFCNCQSESFP